MVCVMPRASTLDLHDRLTDGELSRTLLTMRSDGRSLLDCTAAARDLGVSVSVETIRRWCAQLEAETTEAAS
jgi:hypothetical protein